jgi:hypothetical protein
LIGPFAVVVTVLLIAVLTYRDLMDRKSKTSGNAEARLTGEPKISSAPDSLETVN